MKGKVVLLLGILALGTYSAFSFQSITNNVQKVATVVENIVEETEIGTKKTNGLTMFRGNATRTFYGTGPLPNNPEVLWQYPKEQTVAAPQEARKEQVTAERQAVLDKAAAQQAAIDRVVEQQALRKLGLADTPASAVKKASDKVDALTARVNQLTEDYIAAGTPPDKAKIKAAAQAAEEEKNDRANLEELENAAKSISAAGGTSPEVPSRPRRDTTPEGTPPPPPSGVAPPPVAPGQVDVGAKEPDVALTAPAEPPAPVEPIDTDRGEGISIPSGPDGGISTAGAEPPVAVEVERPAPAAEEPVRRKEAKPTPLTEEERATAFEDKKAKAQQIARTNASTAFDQLGEYGGDLDAALDSYRTNMADTLVEEGFKEGDDWDALLNAADRAFDAEVSKQKGTPSAPTPTETVETKEEGAAAPAEGTAVAAPPATEPAAAAVTEPATAEPAVTKPAPPLKVVKQPRSKDEQGRSVVTLQLSNNESKVITRIDDQWTLDGEPVGATIKDAISRVTKQPVVAEAKRGPKGPRLSEDQRANTAALAGGRTEELNYVVRLITSKKKLGDTGLPGFSRQLDQLFGLRDRILSIPRSGKNADTVDNMLSKVSEQVTPILDALYEYGTSGRYKGTRVQTLAMEQFNRAPENIKKGVIERAKQRKSGTLKQTVGQQSTEIINVFKGRNPPNNAQAAAIAVTAASDKNSFESVLANKLFPVLKGVDLTVVENTIPGGLDPEQTSNRKKLRSIFERENAPGLFAKGTDLLGKPTTKGHVYLAGASFGSKQGINKRTILHELLHAGTARRIDRGVNILKKNPQSSDPDAVAARRLDELMTYTRSKFESESPRLLKIVGNLKEEGKALYDVNEFLAYGMTDPEFQNFLKSVPYQKVSVFSSFANTLRKLFGLGKDDSSVFTNLIDVTDQLLTPSKKQTTTPDKTAVLAQSSNIQTAADVQVQYANDVINTPRSQGPSVSLLDQVLATGLDVKGQADIAKAIMEGAMSSTRKPLLGAFTPSQIAKLVADEVPALTRVVDSARKFNAKRQQYLDKDKELMKPWLKLQRDNLAQSQLLSTVMHLASVNGIDPDTNPGQSDTMDTLWGRLNEPAKQIYKDVRDHYAKRFEDYKRLVEARIQNMNISNEEKTKFMALLREQFETNRVVAPYFPLMRYGDNWLMVKTPQGKEFYMFESPSERNVFALRRAREMGRSADSLYQDQTFKRGDQISGVMEEGFADSTQLKQILASVDSMTTIQDKAGVKDQIYQLYLLTLPEKSFRKSFIHRKNTAGYSADALRNLGTAGFRMSNQLARLEYEPAMRNGLDEAKESLKDNPDRYKYIPYVEEVAESVESITNPKNENSILNFAANGLSTLNFFYYMSSISSAITNFTSLPVFGYPTLLAEFGRTASGAKDVHMELLRFLNVYKQVGFRRKTTDAQGNVRTEYVMPSVRNVLTDPGEIAAYQSFAADNLFTFNRSIDLLNIVKSPSQEATNPNILKVPVKFAIDAVSTMFSATDQLTREVMAMTAYRVGIKQGLTPEQATKKAIELTHNSMFDYSLFDTPRYFKGPVGRTLFQFKKFAQNTAFYLATNATQIFTGADPTIKKQALARLLGTLGMTGMFAGVTGLPLYTVITTVIEKALQLRDDDDEDSVTFQVSKYGFDLWFKNYLAENFGPNVAAYVAYGPATALTGADLNSRVKLNDLFFPDWEYKGLLGPTFGLYENAQRAYDRFKEGQTERAIEMLLPAVIRQPVKAYRFGEEGVVTPKGYEVVSSDDLSKMDLALQAIGFSPIKVSAKQQENYKLKKLEREREEERTDLLKRAVYARREISDEDMDEVQEDIDKFNDKFPNRRILPSNIIQSEKARRAQDRVLDDGLFIANPMTRRELLELRSTD